MFLDRIQYLIFLTERLRKTMADYSAYFWTRYLANIEGKLPLLFLVQSAFGKSTISLLEVEFFVYGKLWRATTSRILRIVTLDARWWGLAALEVDAGWLRRMAAPLDMLCRLGRI
jgi:hypothetical protein